MLIPSSSKFLFSKKLNYNKYPYYWKFVYWTQRYYPKTFPYFRLIKIDQVFLYFFDFTQATKLKMDLRKSIRKIIPAFLIILQPDAGNARHDAVAWGYARAADQLGVDIIQNCEVIDFIKQGERIIGVKTSRGDIHAEKVGMAVAGSSSRLADKLGLRLPIESHVLQAFVSEGLKPLLPGVITFGAGHFYCSQSDKGGLVFGGDIDGYNSYAQRGNLPIVQDVTEAAMSILPCLGRVKLLRQWAGVVDMSMDGTHFICKTPLDNLYLNAGWNYGGFKATPASGWWCEPVRDTTRSTLAMRARRGST